MERLQRILSARGIASRRVAEEMILAGRVTVNGQPVTELGSKANPDTDVIRVDGKVIRPQASRYVMLNKPRGFITTTNDERNRSTVMDLIKTRERLYPIGRLDRETEGLLLLTNDGELANRVMHPRFGLEKEYHIRTPERPDPRVLERVRRGIEIEGKRVVPNEFRLLRETREGIILTISLHEGLYHVVRRLMDHANIPVDKLTRVRVGPIMVAGLGLGQWRDLTDGERSTLFEAVHMDLPEDDAASRRTIDIDDERTRSQQRQVRGAAPGRPPARPDGHPRFQRPGDRRDFRPRDDQRPGDRRFPAPRDQRPAGAPRDGQPHREPGFQPREGQPFNDRREFRPRDTDRQPFEPRNGEHPGERREFRPRDAGRPGDAREHRPREFQRPDNREQFTPRDTQRSGDRERFQPRDAQRPGDRRDGPPRDNRRPADSGEFRPGGPQRPGDGRGFQPRDGQQPEHRGPRRFNPQRDAWRSSDQPQPEQASRPDWQKPQRRPERPNRDFNPRDRDERTPSRTFDHTGRPLHHREDAPQKPAPPVKRGNPNDGPGESGNPRRERGERRKDERRDQKPSQRRDDSRGAAPRHDRSKPRSPQGDRRRRPSRGGQNDGGQKTGNPNRRDAV